MKLTYAVNCQGCKGETNCLVKERIKVRRQHIWQPQYQNIKGEESTRLCFNEEF